ncbi:MAG: hypothetical protein AB1846_13170 [Chloroflexota bacterium]
MAPSTIGSINLLPEQEKREIYRRVIPPELLEHFHLSPFLVDREGRSLLKLRCAPGSTSVEMSLYHKADFPDPVLYGHMTDTMNGQLHMLLYIMNDPDSPRFDVDKMPDGRPTRFGTLVRHTEAELAAMQAGLTPGQVRRGIHLLAAANRTFEEFIKSLGHEQYFVEPLYYHNAVIFERYGMAYQQGRRLMERIQAGFSEGGELLPLLNGSSPFRQPGAKDSIRLRSWAIHDGILGEPFTNVTMYKKVGKHAGVSTCGECKW